MSGAIGSDVGVLEEYTSLLEWPFIDNDASRRSFGYLARVPLKALLFGEARQIEPPVVASPLVDDPLIGRCLNDTYQIEGWIGQGGMGRVYRARHARIRTKLFALKVLHPEHSRDPGQLARFQQEAEAAAALSHPHVVGVYDVGRTLDGYSYLACELLSGQDLDVHLEKHKRLSPRSAILMGLQICDALEAAHAQNIVHRDLKPQNVFLLNGVDGALPPYPDIKLLDFGLSRFLDHSDTQLTKTGTVLGTPAYMAPEQAMGNRGDHRVDVYGVGVILYTALTGRAPFVEETLTAMLVAVMTADPPRPQKIVPDLPESLELLIQKAMAKDPDQRYQTMGDVRLALEGALSSVESEAPTAVYRPRLGSMVLAGGESEELRTSRPRLVLYALAALMTGALLLTTALKGLELWTGPLHWSQTELILVLLGVAGTLLMPSILALRGFRRSVWSNSARVVDWLGYVRGPLLAGLVAYGFASLVVRFADEFVSRFGDAGGLFRAEPGIAWPGFTWVFSLVFLWTASLVYAKRRWSEGPDALRRRFWLGAPLWAVTVGGATLIVAGGLQVRVWRPVVPSTQVEVVAASTPVVSSREQQEASEEVDAQPPDLVPEQRPVPRASDEELALALTAGEEGLLPLSERYPADPRVLEPLLTTFSTRATGLVDAMVLTKRLLSVAPEKRDSEGLATVLIRAARTPGEASDRAFEILVGDLGSRGSDLLYQLKKGGGRAGEKAAQFLNEPSLRETSSPALRIALELEAASSCTARLPLLERAKVLGDERSVQVLAPLAKGTKTGCGKWKNKPCLAPCHAQAKEYWDAIQAISSRAPGAR